MQLTVILHIIISLLTCEPGEELYARFGHTALRVQDTELHTDIVFNYGLFDFNQPNFYRRFVAGETYYQIGAQHTADFMRQYAAEGRQVYQQVLNLREEDARYVCDSLLRNMRPENREYLYNFVYDNCATRPYRLIRPEKEDAVGRLTYRELIAQHVGEYHYAMFGINLLLGSRADQPADSLWLPRCVMNRLDGDTLVAAQHIGTFRAPTFAWVEDIRPWIVLFAFMMLTLTYRDVRRRKLTWGVDLALIVLYALVLALVCYLTFFSLHPLVGFGYRLLTIPTIHLCSRLFYFVPSRC